MINKLNKIALATSLYSTLMFGAVDAGYAKEKPKEPQSTEERSILEDILKIPNCVRKFRKDLNQGPEGRELVLVELAPGMKRYILSDKDGDLIKSFAKHELHMNDEDIDQLVYQKPDGGHVDYMGHAFRCTPFSNLYNQIQKTFNKMDTNHNLVIEPRER